MAPPTPAELKLNALPPEVIKVLSKHLPSAEMKNLRLTSREMQTKLFDDFVLYHFTDFKIHLDKHDLQMLVDISKRPAFAKRIRKLRLWPVYVDAEFEESMVRSLGEGYDFGLVARARQEHARAVQEQTELLSEHKDVILLTEALRRLVGVKYIHIGHYDMEREVKKGSGQMSARSIVIGQWPAKHDLYKGHEQEDTNPEEHARNEQDSGHDEREADKPEGDEQEKADTELYALVVALTSVAAAGSEITTLEVETEDDVCNMVNLMQLEERSDTFRAALGKLCTFSLMVEFGIENGFERGDEAIAHLIGMTPHLTELNLLLNGQPYEWGPPTANDTGLRLMRTLRVRLPGLFTFNIGNASLYGGDLSEFLENHPLLRKLVLQRIVFTDSEWRQPFDFLQSDGCHVQEMKFSYIGDATGLLLRGRDNTHECDACMTPWQWGLGVDDDVACSDSEIIAEGRANIRRAVQEVLVAHTTRPWGPRLLT